MAVCFVFFVVLRCVGGGRRCFRGPFVVFVVGDRIILYVECTPSRSKKYVTMAIIIASSSNAAAPCSSH
jgi:hypothetical protein